MKKRVLVIGAGHSGARIAAIFATAQVVTLAVSAKPIIDSVPPYAKFDNEKPWGKRKRNKFGGIRTK